MPAESPIPQFNSPPVVETVMGVFFRPLEGFNIGEQVLFWAMLREEFPKLEERAPLDEVQEQFGRGHATSAVPVRWRVTDRRPMPRLWASSSDGSHVIQIQRNAVFSNWLRTTETGAKYLHYPERRARFCDYIAKLNGTCSPRGAWSVEPTSCQLRYINHIVVGESESMSAAIARSIEGWTGDTADGWLSSADSLEIRTSFPMPEQLGRLHCQISPAVRLADNAPIIRVDLLARGQPRENNIASALEWMDLGHEWAVRGFTSLTTPEMHSAWQRVQ